MSHSPELLHILVLEDNENDQRLLDRLLRHCPSFRIERQFAQTVREAKELLSLISFDVILVDYKVLNGSGLNLLSQLDGAAPNVPVIVVTGSEEGEDFATLVTEHAVDVLFKNSLTLRTLNRAIYAAVMGSRNSMSLARIAELEAEVVLLKTKPVSNAHKIIHALPDFVVWLIGVLTKQG